MRGAVVALATLAALLAAGCLQEAPSPGGACGWALSGAFTEDATQAQMRELGETLRARFGAQLAILESFPAQLRVTGLTEEDCPQARALVASKPFVARVGGCERAATAGDPDAPTSSG